MKQKTNAQNAKPPITKYWIVDLIFSSVIHGVFWLGIISVGLLGLALIVFFLGGEVHLENAQILFFGAILFLPMYYLKRKFKI